MTASFNVSLLKFSFIAKREEKYNNASDLIPEPNFCVSNANKDMQ